MLRPESKLSIALALVCGLFGAAIAVVPHATEVVRSGDSTWIADGDEIFYLQVASQAYRRDPLRMGDPALADGGRGIYKALPLAPGIVVARVLGLPPIAIGLCWRAWAGFTIGLAWFMLSRGRLRTSGAALALAFVMICDAGAAAGRPFVDLAWTLVRIGSGNDAALFAAKPILMPQWRISTPALTLAYLIAALAAAHAARDRPSPARVIVAGFCIGLLFYVYFYYWTAVILALGIVWLIDAGHRRLWFSIGLAAVAVGMPSLLADFEVKRSTAPDWLHRSDKFLEIGRFDELLLPRGALALAALAGWFVIRRRRDLLFPWAIAAAGLLLMNHQIITRLQIENFHWHYAWGPCLALTLLLPAAELLDREFARSRAAKLATLFGVAAIAAAGLVLREQEATRSRDSRELTEGRRATAADRPTSLAPGRTIAGPRAIVDQLAIDLDVRPLDGYAVRLSSTLLDDQWFERRALNAYLSGRSRDEYLAEERESIAADPWGSWARNPAARERRLARLLELFDRIESDPGAVLERWDVGYVVESVGPPPPAGAWRPLDTPRAWTRIDPDPREPNR